MISRQTGMAIVFVRFQRHSIFSNSMMNNDTIISYIHFRLNSDHFSPVVWLAVNKSAYSEHVNNISPINIRQCHSNTLALQFALTHHKSLVRFSTWCAMCAELKYTLGMNSIQKSFIYNVSFNPPHMAYDKHCVPKSLRFLFCDTFPNVNQLK